MGCNGCGGKKNNKVTTVGIDKEYEYPQWMKNRIKICNGCQHLYKDVCVFHIGSKKLSSNVDAIDSICADPNTSCPADKWANIEDDFYKPENKPSRNECVWCSRIMYDNRGVCRPCVDLFQVEVRNSKKGYNRNLPSRFSSADDRSHEIVPSLFTSEVKKDLYFFLYPKYEGSVKYHIDKLKEHIDQFNGNKICCLAVDKSTCQNTFINELESIFTDIFTIKNDPRKREAAGLVEGLSRLITDDPNRVACFAHGKGQQRHTENSKNIRKWTDAMYETCVGNWDDVKTAMEKGYPLAGSFKVIGGSFRNRFRWHYSGTFYWVRSSVISVNSNWRDICNRWWAAESYVGRHWTQEEGYCLFGDNVKGGAMYNDSTWVQMDEALKAWRINRGQKV